MTGNLEAAQDNAALSMTADQVDTSAFGDIKLVKDVIGGAENLSKGDVEAAKGDIESFLSDAASCAADPITFLAGTGVEFVLDFVTPVRDAIQLVTGDSEALTQGAKAFSEVSQDLEQLAEKLTQTLDGDLAEWEGQAADAMRTKMGEFIDGVQNTAGQAHNLSELLQMSSTMMEAAEGVIKGILAEFLTWAVATWLTALATAPATAGGSTAAAGAATTVEAAITCARTAEKVKKVVKTIEMVQLAITAIKAVLDSIRIAESVQQITDGADGKGGNSDAQDGSEAAGNTNDGLTEVKSRGDHVAKQNQERAEEAGYTLDDTNKAAVQNEDGSTTQIKSDGELIHGTTSQNTPSYGAADWGKSGLNQVGSGLDTAADQLEEQAKGGGFSDVPSDKTIEGQLDW
ncbi:WXG100 family type VII secretion target [Saccharopolyspora sp. HNM0983]|uniref:WXG100 family type VII secretion target n=1 Tax=Saccharopolyspora montiporae TaxID=2781240 RepID=A0A929BAT6_9PSEU|nr:WXG100 family type VII secretion target [Saccharopolyspora sp. HNM0983]MBE9374965.1 WXG100 family type VII secretion target [Saccharopolyspora sp. HNM0983]